MKIFTQSIMRSVLALALFSFMILPAFAQNGPIDFEAGGFGADWTWTVFENDDNPAVEIIPNPDANGANTSATVAQFTARVTGQPFAGCETMHGADVGTFEIGPSNSTISIMVWKSVISDVGIKLVTAAGGALPEIKIPNTVINQWEEITFDFSSQMLPEPFDQIVIFPDFNARAQENIVYFDNITFGEAVEVGEPMTAAPDPTEDPADVISMFSNVYTDVAVDTWRTEWSNATLEDIQIQGNDTKKYTALDFVGVEAVANTIDATEMTHFHVDMWTPNMTTFRVKLVDFGADGAFDGGDDTDAEIAFENPAIGEWVSLDIPLANFSGLASREHLAQLIFSGLPTGGGTVYIDNVYFHKGEVTVNEPMTAAPDPINDPADVISMFSNVYTDVTVDTWRTDWSNATLEDIQIQGNDTKKYTALDFVGIETVGGNVIDASEMTHFRVDAWTPNMTTLRIKWVDFGPDGAFDGGDDSEHELVFENPNQGEWLSFDIPLTAFAGLTNTSSMAQLIFSGLPSAGGTLYVDNVFFYKGATVIDEPMTAAPDPTENAANVISMFSNVYSDVAVDTWRTDWSNATLEDIQIQGNDTKKYTALDFVGVETVDANTIDATTMTHFHMDVWTPNMTTFRIKLVDFGADGAFDGGDDTEHELVFENPALGEWISYQIPLSDFTGLMNTTNMAQYIFSGLPSGGGTLFVDNVYFSNDPTSVSSFKENNIELFPNPVHSTFTIDTDKNLEEVRIYDALGSLVLNKRVLNNTSNFNIAHLSNGIYVVVAIIDGETVVDRLIKN